MVLNDRLTANFATIVIIVVCAVGLFQVFRGILGLIALTGHSLTPLPEADKTELLRISPFYAALPESGKKAFSKRVKEFIFEKDWEGRGIELTREMKLHIAAVAVQISFGIGKILFLNFNRVVVYPDQFKDRRSGKEHLGDVAPVAGRISLSWKHFLKGEQERNDALNLGLHEMAHALWFENKNFDAEVDFFDQPSLKQWRVLAEEEAERLNSGHSRLFRSYAGTNQAEFFAVAVEYFFEQPRAFKEELPELYATMVMLLKQDPIKS